MIPSDIIIKAKKHIETASLEKIVIIFVYPEIYFSQDWTVLF